DLHTAMEILTDSGTAPVLDGGSGLAPFLRKAARDDFGRALVFVPPVGGFWLERVRRVAADRAAMGAPLDCFVCVDGISDRKGEGPFRRLLFAPPQTTPVGWRRPDVPRGKLEEVMDSLSRAGARVFVVDRTTGTSTGAESLPRSVPKRWRFSSRPPAPAVEGAP
ncbi:MAG: hypothetical protein KC416_17200, partial [Myxococcales bacterium]|nr:hypothetical protein [Myxococcales bacterium]